MTLHICGRRSAPQRARIMATVACVASFLFLTSVRAKAQGKLNRIEWFAESGGSFLSLGAQPGVFQVPAATCNGRVCGPFLGMIVSSSRYSSAYTLLTGLRYRITDRDRLELSYDESVNHFTIQPLGGGVRETSTFERTPSLTVNYARYFGKVSGWKPFVVGGAGVAWQSSLVSRFDRTDPSFDFGFGADRRLTDRLAFRVEVRDYVERLPSPLRGYSNVIAPTAGLVVSSGPPGTGGIGLSRIEVYIEGGGSFFTGGSAPSRAQFCTQSGACSVLPSVIRGSISKTGRYAGGFRIYLSKKDALQFEYSAGPNHSQTQESATVSPYPSYPPLQNTDSIQDSTVDYVRYLLGRRAVEPFISAGGGWAHFAGFYTGDVDRFCWDFGGGVDIPLAKQLALRFEMRDFLSPQPYMPRQPIHGWTNNITPMAGLALRFR